VRRDAGEGRLAVRNQRQLLHVEDRRTVSFDGFADGLGRGDLAPNRRASGACEVRLARKCSRVGRSSAEVEKVRRTCLGPRFLDQTKDAHARVDQELDDVGLLASSVAGIVGRREQVHASTRAPHVG